MALPRCGDTTSGEKAAPHFDFTWSGLKKATKRLAPMETMHFGSALHRILQQVLAADPCLGRVYISQVDLADT